MPKGVHHRNTPDIERLGMDLRTKHIQSWPLSFNSAGRPVAYCGAELYPRSLKFINIEPPADTEMCEECYG